MADAVPAEFFDLATLSSDWRLNCPTHGKVQMVVVFNNDIANRSYCQACFETGMATISKKTTFATNGGPAPAAATTRP
jgi:hypothetical protein